MSREVPNFVEIVTFMFSSIQICQILDNKYYIVTGTPILELPAVEILLVNQWHFCSANYLSLYH